MQSNIPKLKHLFLLSCLLLTTSLLAQIENTLLWKIEGQNLPGDSYLYGTMHLQDQRVFEFGDSVLPALQSREALAVEYVEDGGLGSMFKAMGALQMKGTKLSDLLTPAEYQKVLQLCEESMGAMAGLLINKMKPLFVSSMITMGRSEQDQQYPLDMYLQVQAKEWNKELIGVETMEEQMAAIDRIPLEEQAQMLIEYVNNLDETDDELEIMIEAYRTQDLKKIEALTYEFADYESFDQELLVKRNHVMSHRIDSIIQLQTTFVAVGTAHLVGETGIIEQLRETGFQVTPVFSKYTEKPTASTTETSTIDFSQWPVYQSKKRKYQIRFPETPTVQNYIKKTAYTFGEIMEVVSLQEQNTSNNYSVKVAKVPKNLKNKEREDIYKNILSEIFKSGEDIKVKEIIVNGLTGKQVELDLENNQQIQLWYVLDKKGKFLYMPSTLTSDPSENKQNHSKEVEFFLYSFGFN